MELTPPHSTTLGTISTFLKYKSKYYLRYYWLKCHKKYTLYCRNHGIRAQRLGYILQ